MIEPVDLLVFGPHPDDLEIGLGGTIAKQTALGFAVGLCDLTAGEMGSNGTVEERLAEAEAARGVLGARWRVNLRWPDRGIDDDGELRNMYKPTPQKGLWFTGGGFAQGRVWSHYVALQIKAREAGIVS